VNSFGADFTKSSLDINLFHFHHGPPPVLRWRTYIWPCSERKKRRPRETITVEFYIFFFLTSTERFSVNVKFIPREYLSYWSNFVVYMKFFSLHVVSASSYCIGTEHRKCCSFLFTKILLPRLFQFIIHNQLLTHSMEQRPSWEANRYLASHETYRIVWSRKFNTAFTTARHLSLSWATLIQSMPQYTTSRRSVLIIPSHLRLHNHCITYSRNKSSSNISSRCVSLTYHY
jgi:hypothetical protein